MIFPKYDEYGMMVADERYTEIRKLQALLELDHIPHQVTRIFDGWQVWYPSKAEHVCDAIEHFGSYGAEQNLLEIMGLLTANEEAVDSVKGFMTAKEVFERIKIHYAQSRKEKEENE